MWTVNDVYVYVYRVVFSCRIFGCVCVCVCEMAALRIFCPFDFKSFGLTIVQRRMFERSWLCKCVFHGNWVWLNDEMWFTSPHFTVRVRVAIGPIFLSFFSLLVPLLILILIVIIASLAAVLSIVNAENDDLRNELYIGLPKRNIIIKTKDRNC